MDKEIQITKIDALQLESVTKPISIEDIKKSIKKSCHKESSRLLVRPLFSNSQMPLQRNFTKPSKSRESQCYINYSRTQKRKGKNPYYFLNVSITLISKPGKEMQRKRNYRLLSLLNTNAKILNKKLVNRAQDFVKKIIQQKQVRLILATHGQFDT